MSDFWTKKLQANTPPAAPPRQTVPSQPWWMPASVPRQEPVEQLIEPQPYEDGEISPERAAKLSRLAPSSQQTGMCPACNSGNYITISNTQVAGKGTSRCYDCGYPIIQSSSGDTLPSTGGEGKPARAAKQLAPAGYHPDMIVGRVE